MKERVDEESRPGGPACQETGAQEQQGQSAGILGSVGGPARTHNRGSPWMLAARRWAIRVHLVLLSGSDIVLWMGRSPSEVGIYSTALAVPEK